MVTDEDSSTSLTLANYLSKPSMGQEQSVLSAFHPETVSIKQETFNTNEVNWIKFIFLNSCSQVYAVVRRTMASDFLRKSITWMDDEIPSRFKPFFSCCLLCTLEVAVVFVVVVIIFFFCIIIITVEPRLSGLVGTSVKSPDNRESG